LSVISVNALKAVTARETGARAFMQMLPVTVAHAPRPAALAGRDPARRAALRRWSAAGLRRLDLAGTRLR
jgi:hypothetical protein